MTRELNIWMVYIVLNTNTEILWMLIDQILHARGVIITSHYNFTIFQFQYFSPILRGGGEIFTAHVDGEEFDMKRIVQ